MKDQMPGRFGAYLDVDLQPSQAFDALIEELADALEARQMRFQIGPGGSLTQFDLEVARVLAWEPGRKVLLQWRAADWVPDQVTELELRFEPLLGGTRVTLEHRGWGDVLGDPGAEAVGWFASEVAATLLEAASPRRFGDWLTDRRARRPSGAGSRSVYRDPIYHRPNFMVLLDWLQLGAGDHLLEVGCGGGAFLEEALRLAPRAAAIDHSSPMVRLAREVNRDAVAEGRLQILEASAESLPFPDDTFTAAVMTGVLGFLPDPLRALAEIRRVLRSGGRLALFGSSPELRGTPAAPEPMASRLRFYEDPELERLGREAGLAQVRVERRDLGRYAREAGVPEEHLWLFTRGPGAQFLFARKD
jgi:SAM-dependent methyltransferase